MTRRIDELNALEEAEAEQVSGASILSLETDQPVAKLLGALAWVHKRRTDPKLKYGDYLKSARTKDNVAYLFRDSDDLDDDEQPDVALEPDPEARVLDDDGTPTEPFRAEAAPSGEAETPGGVDDAESAVLSLDRDSA